MSKGHIKLQHFVRSFFLSSSETIDLRTEAEPTSEMASITLTYKMEHFKRKHSHDNINQHKQHWTYSVVKQTRTQQHDFTSQVKATSAVSKIRPAKKFNPTLDTVLT